MSIQASAPNAVFVMLSLRSIRYKKARIVGITTSTRFIHRMLRKLSMTKTAFGGKTPIKQWIEAFFE